MKKPLIALALFHGLFAFYLSNAAPSVTTGDSGEFMTAADTLSIPHAPSYPLYSIAGKCFLTLVPFGSEAYRCNVFSAFTSAGTGVLLLLIGEALGGGLLLSLLTALLIGVSASFWENSLVTEVFALNTFFVVALLLCLVKRQWLLAAFLFGVGMGNHQILLFLAPAFLLAVIPAKAGIQAVNLPFKGKFKTWIPAFAGMTMLFLLGFSIYLVLPIRSFKQPPLNWGQPTTVHKLYRTITRKDYGSLKLALGDAPERNAANAALHLKTFIKHLGREVPWPIAMLAIAAMMFGMWKREPFAFALTAVFAASGPFFFWLGNLPFNAQSDGIVGRFMIMPAVALLISLLFLLKEHKRTGAAALMLALLLTFQKNRADAAAHRSTTLVLDYGRAMLRTLPANATLFLDGGDDAFYSLAMLRYVMGKRPDLSLHDRGGLVFKNPYGADFRSIPKEKKEERRWEVEREAMKRGPVFYATMDAEILPGVKLQQKGFLMVAGGTGDLGWAHVLLRSLYPLEPNVYRMRALGCFFPYMRGKQMLKDGRLDDALRQFQRAQIMGRDVDWLATNLGFEYAQTAYGFLVKNQYALSERVYRQWLAFDPVNFQAHSNLGVVLERSGRVEEAKAQYQQTAKLFPQSADPVFNLAVLAWKMADWPTVVSHLEEVVRRKPDHLQAQGYLKTAREKMRKR